MENQITTAANRYDLTVMEEGKDKEVLALIGAEQTIYEMGRTREAILLAASVFKECAEMVGAKQGTDEEWKQAQGMMFDALISSYGAMTWSEVRQAFRMVMSAELNAYLPRDASGEPKKECIGRFKPAYFLRVLDAYRKRRSDAQRKYYEQKAAKDREKDEQSFNLQTQEREAYGKRRTREIYDRWKETRSLVFHGADDVIIYGWMQRHGLIGKDNVKDIDREEAYKRFMGLVEAKKVTNPYAIGRVKKEGRFCGYLDEDAYLFMVVRVIREAFERFERLGW